MGSELEPLEPSASSRPTPERPSARMALAIAIATGFGVGLAPVAPGTFGSLLGVALFFGLAPLPGRLWVVTGLGLCALGVWASSYAEAWFGREDDARIVIDEVAGQVIALSPLLFFRPTSLLSGVVTGFVAFRLFDIWKPGPVRWAERGFDGGVGVMADDIVAGALAASVLAALGALGVLGLAPRQEGLPL